MADGTLLVVNGPGRGVRFEVSSGSGEIVMGRSIGTRIRIDDTEVSRQHAVIVHDGRAFRLRDLKSANGTFLNGDRISEAALRNGDSIRIGTTALRFQLSSSHGARDASQQTQLVTFVDDSASNQHSAIVQQVEARQAAEWPEQKAGLDLLYQVAEELVRPFDSQEALLGQILELTLKTVKADRGCILLRDPIGRELIPVVYQQQAELGAEPQQMAISRSITGHVLRHGNAVRTSDALHDARFGAANSILSSGIREAICAPLRGREDLLGVIYLDTTIPVVDQASGSLSGRLVDEHLKVVLAVARQTALAVETRQFQDALLKAERFAAMGQTVAVLSHHIKNILQGVGGGGYLIRKGVKDGNAEMAEQGLGIVERNHGRISDLVMDMLSFSKERVPDLQAGDVNEVCRDVMQLAETRATENGVSLELREGSLPTAHFDSEGIHRALLNIVLNGIDAVAEHEDGCVIVQTEYDSGNDVMLVAVTDNGPGIPDEQHAAVFQVFESSKGERGTGIGLPVSRKIIREHGGRIRIEGGPGQGTRFVLSWPRGNPEERLDSGTSAGQ
ncbi:MAG: ATP-binding protein [Planctomycetaceae bacterium]|nr:ATP-binding protein [Planctomycetaceae bacterium]